MTLKSYKLPPNSTVFELFPVVQQVKILVHSQWSLVIIPNCSMQPFHLHLVVFTSYYCLCKLSPLHLGHFNSVVCYLDTVSASPYCLRNHCALNQQICFTCPDFWLSNLNLLSVNSFNLFIPNNLGHSVLLNCFLQVGGAIDYESYVRIKHRDTGTWMHLNKGRIACLTSVLCSTN